MAKPDVVAARVFAVIDAALEPVSARTIADATGLTHRAALTACTYMHTRGRLERTGDPLTGVRFSVRREYPPLPRPRWPDKLRARLIADLGPRVTRVA